MALSSTLNPKDPISILAWKKEVLEESLSAKRLGGEIVYNPVERIRGRGR